MKQLHDLVRPNIWRLAPYSSARNEYSGHEAHVFLDANENPYNSPFNRYPDPLQTEVKAKLSKYKQVKPECIFLGNGSDEAIDLVYSKSIMSSPLSQPTACTRCAPTSTT